MKKLRMLVSSVMLMAGLCGTVIAGSLDSPGDPSHGSGMYTLLQVYNYLSAGTAPVAWSYFQGPSAGPTPGAGTMKTTVQIVEAVQTPFALCGATAANVESGVKFFCTQSGRWGVKTGTLTDPSDVIFEAFTDANGYNNYVNVGNTTATFDTNKYKRANNTPIYDVLTGTSIDGGKWTTVIGSGSTGATQVENQYIQMSMNDNPIHTESLQCDQNFKSIIPMTIIAKITGVSPASGTSTLNIFDESAHSVTLHDLRTSSIRKVGSGRRRLCRRPGALAQGSVFPYAEEIISPPRS